MALRCEVHLLALLLLLLLLSVSVDLVVSRQSPECARQPGDTCMTQMLRDTGIDACRLGEIEQQLAEARITPLMLLNATRKQLRRAGVALPTDRRSIVGTYRKRPEVLRQCQLFVRGEVESCVLSPRNFTLCQRPYWHCALRSDVSSYQCECQLPEALSPLCHRDADCKRTDASPSCEGRGRCALTYDAPRRIACHCPAGYRGRYCEKPRLCHPINPCQNNGRCQMKGKRAKCICSPSYQGPLCEVRRARPKVQRLPKTTVPSSVTHWRTNTTTSPPSWRARTTSPPWWRARTTSPPWWRARTTSPPWWRAARTTSPPWWRASTTSPPWWRAGTTSPPWWRAARTTSPSWWRAARTTSPPWWRAARTTSPPPYTPWWRRALTQRPWTIPSYHAETAPPAYGAKTQFPAPAWGDGNFLSDLFDNIDELLNYTRALLPTKYPSGADSSTVSVPPVVPPVPRNSLLNLTRILAGRPLLDLVKSIGGFSILNLTSLFPPPARYGPPPTTPRPPPPRVHHGAFTAPSPPSADADMEGPRRPPPPVFAQDSPDGNTTLGHYYQLLAGLMPDLTDIFSDLPSLFPGTAGQPSGANLADSISNLLPQIMSYVNLTDLLSSLPMLPSFPVNPPQPVGDSPMTVAPPPSDSDRPIGVDSQQRPVLPPSFSDGLDFSDVLPANFNLSAFLSSPFDHVWGLLGPGASSDAPEPSPTTVPLFLQARDRGRGTPIKGESVETSSAADDSWVATILDYVRGLRNSDKK